MAALHDVHPELFVEVSSTPPRELIVTADGNRELFPLVRSLVAGAPSVAGWTFHALRPKRGFPSRVRWNEVDVALEDVAFDPLERPGSSELGLRFYASGLDERDADDAHNAILRALDHALGEERFAETIVYTELQPMPAGATANDFIPLADLERYLEWRERKRNA